MFIGFSEKYSKQLEYKEKVRALVSRARDELKGGTLYGELISINNPEELIACLYILYKDYDSFHERM
jgi:hypothetical protein